MSRILVLLAEDHETVREGLKLLIDAQPDMRVVGEVASGRGVVERNDGARSPCCRDGYRHARDQRSDRHARTQAARARDIAVVALTRHDDKAYVQELLRGGASGYVLKRSPSGELLAAIRAAASGRSYLDPALGARIAGGIRRGSAGLSPATPGVSERENQVLRMMAHGHSNKEIANSLGISVKTVEVHKANAMKKMDFHGRIDVVRYAMLQGWLQDD